MEKLKHSVLDFISEFPERMKIWIAKILNITDSTTTQLDESITKHLDQFVMYINKREEISKVINEKQREIERLHQKLYEEKTKEVKQINDLFLRLKITNNAYIKTQERLMKLENEKELLTKRVNEIAKEKAEALINKNTLKDDLDFLQLIYKHNNERLQEVNQELVSLKSIAKYSQVESPNVEKLIAEKEKLITELTIENKTYVEDINQKKLRFDDMSASFNQLNEAKIELDQELLSLTGKHEELKKENASTIKKIKNVHEQRTHYQQKNQELNVFIMKLEADLDESFIQAIEVDEEKKAEHDKFVKQLNEKNRLIEEEKTKQEIVQTSKQAKRVLKKEYEPRFNTLYKNCEFHKDFIKDFMELNSEERLQVEATVSQLDQNINEDAVNIRPNTVKTDMGAILESGFRSHNNTGRIYWRKKNHKITLFRLSLGKNSNRRIDQDKVIKFLQRNYGTK